MGCVCLGFRIAVTGMLLFPAILLAQVSVDYPIVLTRLPATRDVPISTVHGGRTDFSAGATLVLRWLDGSIRPLTPDFFSAGDPDVSFDGKRILFSGTMRQGDPRDIFEMTADGSNIRRITRDLGDCSSPCYQSTLFTLNSPAPWFQMTFVALRGEAADSSVDRLFSCKLDGSSVRRLTYNLADCADPTMMYDGRLLFAGGGALFGINLDGTDFALYSQAGPAAIKSMACSTRDEVIFVETNSSARDRAGTLGAVSIRRPFHSYRSVTKTDDGLFHSPSPLPDGRILVSRRSADSSDTFAVGRMNPADGKFERMIDDPEFHHLQAKALIARPEPDGRSSVVSEDDKTGKLYCLTVSINDLENPQWLSPSVAKRLRVVEGVPIPVGSPDGKKIDPRIHRRVLGQVDIETDGSFNVEIPAAIPIELQLLDEDGLALRTCRWIWAMNHEQRGCIGCHEDPEWTPPNVMAEALTRRSIPLTPEPRRRRTVGFFPDVMPIVSAKCATCHTDRHPTLKLTDKPGDSAAQRGGRAYRFLMESSESTTTGKGKYIVPGEARNSPLIWRIFGRGMSRPWDPARPTGVVKPMPPKNAKPLTSEEKQTLVEWIDLGAAWDGSVEYYK